MPAKQLLERLLGARCAARISARSRRRATGASSSRLRPRPAAPRPSPRRIVPLLRRATSVDSLRARATTSTLGLVRDARSGASSTVGSPGTNGSGGSSAAWRRRLRPSAVPIRSAVPTAIAPMASPLRPPPPSGSTVSSGASGSDRPNVSVFSIASVSLPRFTSSVPPSSDSSRSIRHACLPSTIARSTQWDRPRSVSSVWMNGVSFRPPPPL